MDEGFDWVLWFVVIMANGSSRDNARGTNIWARTRVPAEESPICEWLVCRMCANRGRQQPGGTVVRLRPKIIFESSTNHYRR